MKMRITILVACASTLVLMQAAAAGNWVQSLDIRTQTEYGTVKNGKTATTKTNKATRATTVKSNKSNTSDRMGGGSGHSPPTTTWRKSQSYFNFYASGRRTGVWDAGNDAKVKQRDKK